MYKQTYKDLIVGHVEDTTGAPEAGDSYVDTFIVIAFVVAVIVAMAVL
ncbi:hypothetical protein NB640_12510 [Oxalobacter vibrioformis]|uniref:Uncharacterized protein n=1 Tax=Oxalobacter vibrioformis TaxID=933080 RepID=A0A9E9P3A6_9BURK|nr:hypothetical protein [Oxalobacter vibrioformis]WAW10020.1 hypothetical protein NB640_12510 [Oxalobacter vibrioformis]